MKLKITFKAWCSGTHAHEIPLRRQHSPEERKGARIRGRAGERAARSYTPDGEHGRAPHDDE